MPGVLAIAVDHPDKQTVLALCHSQKLSPFFRRKESTSDTTDSTKYSNEVLIQPLGSSIAVDEYRASIKLQ
jgi:hypothetical protein